MADPDDLTSYQPIDSGIPEIIAPNYDSEPPFFRGGLFEDSMPFESNRPDSSYGNYVQNIIEQKWTNSPKWPSALNAEPKVSLTSSSKVVYTLG